jgi:hypothetical protein
MDQTPPKRGRGRPPGEADKPARAQRGEWANSTYGLPTKRFLFASNWWLAQFAEQQQKPAEAQDRKIMIEALGEAMKYAQMAVPYLERRLASITHQVVPYDLTKLTDAELDELERITRRALVDNGSTDGDSERETSTRH